jgi:hypothetical protein
MEEAQRATAAARQSQKEQLAARIQQLGEKQKDLLRQVVQRSEATASMPSPTTPQAKQQAQPPDEARPPLTPLSTAASSKGKEGLGATEEEATGPTGEVPNYVKQSGPPGEGQSGEDWGWWEPGPSGTGSKDQEEAQKNQGPAGQEVQPQQGLEERQEQDRQDQTLGRALQSMLKWGGKNKRFACFLDKFGWSRLDHVAKELKISANRTRKIVTLGAGRFHLYESVPGGVGQNPATVFVRAWPKFYPGPLPPHPPSLQHLPAGGRGRGGKRASRSRGREAGT